MDSPLSETPNTMGHLFLRYLAWLARLKDDRKWALCTLPSPIVTKEIGLVAFLAAVLPVTASAKENARALPTAGGHWDASVEVTT